VIVSGCRTPFAKAGTAFRDLTAVELAKLATRELLARSEVDPRVVDQVVFGQVVPSVLAPNVAREVALLPQFPCTVVAHTVNRACASSIQAITEAHDQIALGQADVVVAGGTESLSDIPILHTRRFSRLLVEAGEERTLARRLGVLARVRPSDLVPVTPAAAEPSTGLSMGQSAEKMAKENGITRDAQDRYALRSHQLAARGTSDGRLPAEIVPVFVPPALETPVASDNGIRPDTDLGQLTSLRPAFDRRHGTVTAGNASPLTDGAAAVLLMNEETARAQCLRALAVIRSYAVAAVDPAGQLLMGPAYAVPMALARAGLSWRDLGLVEMHEAFAAQVLSNVQALESRAWAERHLGRSERIGEVNWEATNVLGGSIAIGHPFGATGARLTMTLAYEMRRRGVEFGLVSVCAQGGMGAAMVLEMVP